MTQAPDIDPRRARDFIGTFGFWAVLAGGLAMVLVFAQIALPSLDPKPSLATQVGEIAGEIRRSAWRGFLGLPQPEPEAVAPESKLMVYFALVAPVFGVVAVVLSLISLVLRENWRFAAYGASLGAAAILFQMFWWIAVLVVCAMLFIAIIENIGDIFSFGS